MIENKIYEIGILTCQEKTFKNSDGELISYNEYSVVINGKKFLLKPYDSAKRFFNYMVGCVIDDIENGIK